MINNLTLSYRHDGQPIMTIRELVIQKRTETGMTQKELAEKAGITQAQISDFENGKRTMTSDNIDKLFAALEINLVQNKNQMWNLAVECAKILKSKDVTNIQKLSKEEVAALTGKDEILAMKEYSDQLYIELSIKGSIDDVNVWNYMQALISFHIALINK